MWVLVPRRIAVLVLVPRRLIGPKIQDLVNTLANAVVNTLVNTLANTLVNAHVNAPVNTLASTLVLNIPFNILVNTNGNTPVNIPENALMSKGLNIIVVSSVSTLVNTSPSLQHLYHSKSGLQGTAYLYVGYIDDIVFVTRMQGFVKHETYDDVPRVKVYVLRGGCPPTRLFVCCIGHTP